MSRMFRLTGTIAALAAAVLASQAQGQARQWPSAEEHAKAFKAICLDHAGDADAQRQAATSAPWNFQEKGKKPDGLVIYLSTPYMLGLRQVDGMVFCNLTVGAPSDRTIDEARAVAGSVLGAPSGALTEAENGFIWNSTPGGKKQLIYYSQFKDETMSVVGWSIGTY